MKFIVDLIRWFITGEEHKNALSSQPVLEVAKPIPTPKEVVIKKEPYKSPTFDLLNENRSEDFMIDLQSIRPLAEQFDRAREDLLKELQRLAPPKKFKRDIFKDVA